MTGVNDTRSDWPRTRRHLRLFLAGLALVVAVRLLTLPDVVREGIVLSSNDPYAYRHAVGQLLEGAGAPWALPEGVATGEPLLVTALWLGSLILGGGETATDVVLATYPVLAAVVTGALVYAIATRASRDRRVGLAAVAVFAVTPAHAYRSSLGFADHHAFDYVWLALTLYCLLVLLSRTERDRRTWWYAIGLGVGVAGQVLAWEAGPLLIGAVALALPAGVGLRVWRGDSPGSLPPIVAGLGGGATVVALAHAGLGWHPLAVVASPWLLCFGAVGLLGLVMAVRRSDAATGVTVAVAVLLVVGALATGLAAWPALSGALSRGVAFLLQPSPIGEMSSLVGDYGVVLGPLIVLGFAPFLALVAIPSGLRTAWREGDPAWIVVAIYAGYFTVLALVQRRFAGELAVALAVLGGYGLVVLLSWLAVLRPLDSDSGQNENDSSNDLGSLDWRRRSLLSGVGAVLFGTGTLYTSVINARITIDAGAVETARWIRDDARDRDLSYPENYVLSQWGRNRMYNHVVNGEAASYAYARQNYQSFLLGRTEEAWYERLDDRVGFVVTRDFERLSTLPDTRLYTRLHRHLGSGGDGHSGLGHFRALHATDDGQYVVFSLVPGATLRGSADLDADRARTDVSIPGAEFEYVREFATEDGDASVTVAHPGRYRIGDRAVRVTERDVRDGTTVQID